MIGAFWTAVAALGVTYVAFPALILVRGVLRPRPYVLGDQLPPVTVVIAAHDEEAGLPSKLASIDALDYPTDRLEVIVASDGSTDATVTIASGWGGPVRVLDLPRTGKAGALNAAVDAAAHDIVVFTDANGRLDRSALRELVRPFADPAVGGVAGDQRYVGSADEGAVGTGERRYWDVDRILKSAESRAGSVISATGGLYALRRSLIDTVPDGVTDDFYISTGAVLRDRRLVFRPEAVVYEGVAPSAAAEYRRKVRVMTRGLHAVDLRRRLLDPRRHGFYAAQLLWHKVLRRLAAVPLVVIAACTPFVLRRGRVYRAAAAGQVAVYALGAVGVALGDRRRSRLLGLPAFFCMANVAALHAAWNVVRGRRIDRWEPTRPGGDPRANL